MSPPGGCTRTSWPSGLEVPSLSAENGMTSSVFGAPPRVVVTCSVPIAPPIGSLWMPTTTAVTDGPPPVALLHAAAPRETAAASAIAPGALLDRLERRREPVGRDPLGEAQRLFAVAPEGDEHRQSGRRAVLLADSLDLGVVFIGGVDLQGDEARPFGAHALVGERLVLELFASATPLGPEIDEQRLVLLGHPR